jgi:hypothetical protein
VNQQRWRAVNQQRWRAVNQQRWRAVNQQRHSRARTQDGSRRDGGPVVLPSWVISSHQLTHPGWQSPGWWPSGSTSPS